jgi:hypothetical protein
VSVPLLEAARELVRRPDAGPAGVWPRAAAFLARQALEEALDRLWDARLPDMRRASRATQLACLSVASSDLELASEVRAAWHALSRACHHHQYELAPTAPELEAWFGQVERLVAALERRPG